MDGNVLAVFVARLGKAVDEALRGLLQRVELAELHDTDLDGVGRGGRAVRRVGVGVGVAAAGRAYAGRHAHGKDQAKDLNRLFHFGFLRKILFFDRIKKHPQPRRVTSAAGVITLMN